MLAAIDVKWLIGNPVLKWLLNLKEARLGDQVSLDLQKPLEYWLLVLIIIPVLFLIGLVYYKESRTAGTTTKVFMAGFRAFVAILLLLMIMQPVVKSQNTDLFRRVILVVIDTTGSMGTVDQDYDKDVANAISNGLYNMPGADVGKIKRLDIVKDYLTNPKIAFLKRLQEKGLVKIVTLDNESKIRYDNPKDVYKEPVGDQKFGDLNADAIMKLQAQSVETNLPQAIRDTMTTAASEAELAGIIVISDGRSTAANEVEDAAAKMQADNIIKDTVSKSGVPVYCVIIGSTKPPKNLMALTIEGPVKATKDSLIPLDVYIRAEQYDSGTVTVILQKEDLDAINPADKGWKDEPGQRQDKILDKGNVGQKIKVSFKFKPNLKPDQKEAHYKFRAVILPVEGEVDTATPENPVDLDNITDPPHYLDVTDRRINVLYVEGTPRYEYRYLKNVLIRKKDEMVVWCLLLSADKEFPQEHTPGTYLDDLGNEQKIEPLKKFPDKDELKKYDVIIWGDVDPTMNSFGISQQACENVRDWVRNEGGGLIAILGESYFPRLYQPGLAGAPLGEVLPFAVKEPAESELYRDRKDAFKYKLTDSGRISDLFKMRENDAENQKYWDEGDPTKDEEGLPGAFFYWPIETDPADMGANVYVRHRDERPQEKDKPGKPAANYALFFEKYMDKGITFVAAMDESWRWRFQTGDEPYFAPFWIKIIKRVAERKLQSETHYYVRTDPKYVSKGDKNVKNIEIKALLLDGRDNPYSEQQLLVWVRRRGDSDDKKEQVMLDKTDVKGVYTGEFPTAKIELTSGSVEYDVWIDDNVASRMGVVEKKGATKDDHLVKNFFVAKIEDREHADRRADTWFLTELAIHSGPPPDIAAIQSSRRMSDISLNVGTAYRMAEGDEKEDPKNRLFPIYAIGEIPDKIQGGDVAIVVSVSNIQVWASWLMFFLILVLLSVEWIVRKWHKLI
jgi:hypothetical protein